MKMPRAFPILFAAVAVLIGVGSLATPCSAQNPMSFADTKQVLGLEGLKHNVSGTLSVENGSLVFTKGKKKVTIPTNTITEVITGKDTERTIGGTVGTLTMFAPYGGGRFLSLFRTKIDTLSIQYHDQSGAVHGAIFTLMEGNAWAAKKALVDQGAKTSVPVEVEAEQQSKKGKK
ncbi:MAG: hypothetical protein WBP79_08115 [Candidatus Acidiferrales bacterium]